MPLRRFIPIAALALIACEETENGITAPCGFAEPCPGANVASIQLALPPGPFLPGDTLSVVVSLRDAQGTLVTAPTTFESSAPSIASVDSLGRVQAIQPGDATITVRAGEREASQSLQIVALVVTDLDVGEDAACALTNIPGRQACWGLADAGQLGFESETVCFADDTLGTERHTCAIAPVGFGPDLSLIGIAVGDSLSCGIDASGNVYCWGADDFGQRGNGASGGEGPQQVHDIGAAFTRVSAGRRHACGIAGDTTFCWGEDSLGQLGDARRVNSTTPIPVVTTQVFSDVSAGLRHTCAINTGGQAFCWGNNEAGALGRGTVGGSFDVPQAVSGGHSFTVISAGDSASCGVRSDGAVLCWGSNTFGTLGVGFAGAATGVPTQVASSEQFVSVSVGADFACALNATGAAFCWGGNGYGQLGNSSGSASQPTPVGGDLTFTKIGAGKRHACGLTSDGSVFCWGSNIFGALGNNLQAAARGLPVEVAFTHLE